MRAIWIALVATVAMACARPPTPQPRDEGRVEARTLTDATGAPAVAPTRRAHEGTLRAYQPAVLSRAFAVQALLTGAVAVGPAVVALRPRAASVPARSRAPPAKRI